jgi:hypothetical protein
MSAKEIKNGTYLYTARFDSDWLTRPGQMLDLIKLMNVTPDAIEFDTSDLENLAEREGFEAA